MRLFQLLLLLLSVVYLAQAQIYESKIGVPLEINQFRSTVDVAVDVAGNIYVVDATSNQIKKFGSNGTPLLHWGTIGSEDGQFSYPQGIAVDASGNVYVADYNSNRIQKFTSSGAFITKWGSYGTGDGLLSAPAGIAVDATGNVYVTDSNNHRIQKFTSSGAFVMKWGSSGSADGQFQYPKGIAVDASGNVYVTDSNNHRIQKFASSGAFVTKWGSNGSGDAQFTYPQGIAVDAIGNVYVADTNGNHRVQKFTSSGAFVTKWGSYGTVDGLFYTPQGIAVDASGNVYVADTGNSRIQKFTSSGSFIWKLASSGFVDAQFNTPQGIAVDASGNVYVVDTNNNRIQKFTSSGVFVTKWGSYGTGDGLFYAPVGIAVDASGNVYVTDTNNHRIQKFTSSGAFMTKWGSYGTGNSQFQYPQGIAVDNGGNIYVTDSYNHRVLKFTSSGAFMTKWGSNGTGDTQFQYPRGIAVDASGNIYVLDSNNNRIQKFTSSSAFVTKWGSCCSEDGQLNTPQGIAADPNGNVYVADSYNYRIQKFTNSGTLVTKWGSYGRGDGQFHTPVGIAVNATGNIYVLDSYNHRFQKFIGLNITSLSSSSGLNGSSITITGTGFSSTTSDNIVKFNGTTGPVTSASPTTLAVTVPPGATTGNVTVTREGYTAQSPGEFLALPLAITSFTPGIGALGTSIAITGTGFSSVNSNNVVKFNGIAATVTSSAANGIIASVPGGNTAGKITVAMNGQTATSASDFGGQLSVDSFSPASALVGSAITINGTGFSATASNQTVKFNGVTATITASTVTSITTTVPAGATTGKISVTRETVTVASTAEFLVLPLVITSFAPGIGAIGTSITITGAGFSSVNANNIVKFNGVAATVTSSSPTSITASMPGGNIAGKITVTVNASTATSADDFGGILSIDSFSPTSAPAGSSVTIKGTAFSTTASNQIVTFRGVTAIITASSLTSITATVPAGATTGKISVTREGVPVESSTEFLVLPLVITSFTPGVGILGSSITITGTGFSSVSTNNIVKFNGVAATVTNSSSTSIVASVPNGNTAGKITVSVNSTIATSEDDFAGILSFSSFTPTSALVGSSVTINGTGFSTIASNQTVKFNGLTSIITASTLTTLTVTVPSGATTGKITITREATTVESTSEFLVLPLAITSFTPGVGAWSSSITITGTGFSLVEGNNVVKINGVAATVTSNSSISLTAIVPDNITNGKITVTVAGQTATSATDFIITKLIITQIDYPEFFIMVESNAEAGIVVNDINEVQSVKFKNRGITADDSKLKVEEVTFSSAENRVVFSIPASYFTDPLGLYSWFSITDKSGNEILSTPGYVYLKYPSTSRAHLIPDIKTGKSISSYQMISVPLELTKKLATNVFADLGGQDDRKWRLFSFEDEVNRENPSLIQTGKGYWFIMRDQHEINPGEGHTVKVTTEAPFKISLAEGWNLIGNPYNFTISANDVAEHNSLSQEVLKFRQYINGAFVNEVMLKRYRGALVYSDASMDIEIPIISHGSSGRKKESEFPSPLDAKYWEVNLTLEEGEFRNELFGFGMNPNAKESKDSWDEVSLPLLEGMSSYNLTFRELGNRTLAKDMVPTQENYSWQALLSSDHGATIHWNNHYFGENDKQLFLESSSQIEVVDMRKAIKVVVPAGDQILKFHYGDQVYIKNQLLENNARIGNVYPNPVTRGATQLSVSVSLPEGTNQVAMQLNDVFGRYAGLSGHGVYDGGRKAIQWEENFSQLPAGVYLLKIEIEDASAINSVLHKKVIIE